MVDNGEEYKLHNFQGKTFEYGWSRDMTKMARLRGVNDDILLDAFVMFPPDEESPLCKAPSPEISCEST